MAHQSFKLPQNDARIDVQIVDGVAWMQKERREKFDCIMVDGYDHHARFGAMGTEAFYRDCRARLARNGMLVLNLFGRTHGYQRQIENLNVAFNNRVLALAPIEEDNHGGNAIVFAVTGERLVLDMPTLRDCAARLHRETGIKLAGTLVRLDQVIASSPALFFNTVKHKYWCLFTAEKAVGAAPLLEFPVARRNHLIQPYQRAGEFDTGFAM